MCETLDDIEKAMQSLVDEPVSDLPTIVVCLIRVITFQIRQLRASMV